MFEVQKNVTKSIIDFKFLEKIVKITLKFSARVLEEITSNSTKISNAHAAEISEDRNFKFVSKNKDQLIKKITLAAGS